MSLSGLNLMVAHQSSVHLYDLRYLDGLVQAKEYFMGVKINCVRSNSELEGIATIAKFRSLVEIHAYQYSLVSSKDLKSLGSHILLFKCTWY